MQKPKQFHLPKQVVRKLLADIFLGPEEPWISKTQQQKLAGIAKAHG